MSEKFDDRNLKALIQALKDNLPSLKVGVMGDSDHRRDSGLTNSEIGMKHEFGMEGLPVRSFLRMPLTDQLQKFLDNSNFFSGDAAKVMMTQVVHEKTITPIVEKIGIVCEAVVQEAFATGGFGNWIPSNMANKKVQLTLVETQQLRNSIGSEVT